MKNKKIKIFCVILICLIGLAAFLVIEHNLNSGHRGERWNIEDPARGFSNSQPISEGILSTGLRYEFHGEFNFYEFRREYNFYLEMATGSTAIATSPMDAAEAGQFFIWPGLRRLQQTLNIEDETDFITVRYCPETDNWVVQYALLENAQIFMIGEPEIYTINRSTGDIIAFSRNFGCVFIMEGRGVAERGEWQRTLGTRPRRTFLQRIVYLFI